MLVCPLARVLCPKNLIPECEKGLRKVGLDAPRLVVNVVVCGVVVGDELQRIPRKRIAAVVVNRLHGRKGKEARALQGRHASDLETNASSEGVEKEPFKRVVVQRAVSVGNIQAVVSGVESGFLVGLVSRWQLNICVVRIKLTVQPSVHMHKSMQKVLPSVENENGDKELHGRDKHMVDDLGSHHFPAGKNGRRRLGAEERIVASSNGAGKHGMRRRHALGNGRGIESKNAKEARQQALGETDSCRPDSNVIFTLANELGRVGQLQDSTRGDLDYLLDDDVAGDLVACGVVAAQDFLGGMQAVLRKEIEGIN